ncbi:MAG: DUF433 domain-containing protein [Xanthomonadaceae bacterium]|jgi:uncharacterized protein (DUF433 family)|nr:DUF433 domain-containing protein [Xanthomonadaceae bacterium]
MDWQSRIVTDPDVLLGKPTIKGSRIAVELVLDRLADGWSIETLLEAYPRLSKEDVQAALAYSAERVREERYLAIGTSAA